MTIEELQTRLETVHARIGHEGRFSFTLHQRQAGPECYVTHWVRTGRYGVEDCKSVGIGSLAECLDALDRYAAAYRRRPTDAEVAATLGVTEAPAAQRHEAAPYAIAAE
jgi:hypothetical protein